MTHFVPIERTGEHSYTLRVAEPLCVGPVGHVFLFGGAGLAAAIRALEQSFNRNLVWATAQYVSFARLGADVQLDVTPAQEGRSVTQATVTARAGGSVIFNVMGALGDRDGHPDQHWRDSPAMPPPDACEEKPFHIPQDPKARLRDYVEVRTSRDAAQQAADRATGRSLFWIRQNQKLPVDAATLALFADFVPGEIGAMLATGGGGNSLDNALRVRKIVPTEWVLCEVQAQAVARGFGHGHMRLYAEDGTLMATASQSIVLRSAADLLARGRTA